MLILDKSTSEQTPTVTVLSLGNREVACVMETTLTTFHSGGWWRRKEDLMDGRTTEGGGRRHPERYLTAHRQCEWG